MANGEQEVFRGVRRVEFWISFAIMLLAWAVTVGSFKQSVDDMKEDFGRRIDRLEKQIDSLDHITRGIP